MAELKEQKQLNWFVRNVWRPKAIRILIFFSAKVEIFWCFNLIISITKTFAFFSEKKLKKKVFFSIKSRKMSFVWITDYLLSSLFLKMNFIQNFAYLFPLLSRWLSVCQWTFLSIYLYVNLWFLLSIRQ